MAEIGTPEYAHLLWGLYFLSVYDTDHVSAINVGGVDEKTYRKWAHPFVEAISFLKYPVVSLSQPLLSSKYIVSHQYESFVDFMGGSFRWRYWEPSINNY